MFSTCKTLHLFWLFALFYIREFIKIKSEFVTILVIVNIKLYFLT